MCYSSWYIRWFKHLFFGSYSLYSFHQVLNRKRISWTRVFFWKAISFVPYLGDLMFPISWRMLTTWNYLDLQNQFSHKLEVWFVPSKPQFEILHFHRKFRFRQKWSWALVQKSDSLNKIAKCAYHIEESRDWKKIFVDIHCHDSFFQGLKRKSTTWGDKNLWKTNPFVFTSET